MQSLASAPVLPFYDNPSRGIQKKEKYKDASLSSAAHFHQWH
jgi:hypothetical protein